uniref:Uncharacterized protein n=1 Tax=Desulfobacca acetoxidans TaxID=60893 RepID=A0A7V4LDT7_9BACT
MVEKTFQGALELILAGELCQGVLLYQGLLQIIKMNPAVIHQKPQEKGSGIVGGIMDPAIGVHQDFQDLFVNLLVVQFNEKHVFPEPHPALFKIWLFHIFLLGCSGGRGVEGGISLLGEISALWFPFLTCPQFSPGRRKKRGLR